MASSEAALDSASAFLVGTVVGGVVGATAFYFLNRQRPTPTPTPTGAGRLPPPLPITAAPPMLLETTGHWLLNRVRNERG